VPDKVVATLKHELRLIETLQYAPYFLTGNSIVRFARSQDISLSGSRLRREFRLLCPRHHVHRS
jgi:DNA polymerase III alpha subunit